LGFYDEISKYYDYIFPTDMEEVNFLSDMSGDPPKYLLDIACGTGGYSLELIKLGYKVTAVDLDQKMVEELKNKAEKLNIDVVALQGNMLEIDKKIQDKFDLAFCIGNSLVHLDGEIEIGMFLKEVKGMLKEDGSLVIQIINYDRILKNKVSFLPTIKNAERGLEFSRTYRCDNEENKIFFKTVLKVDGKIIQNEIALYPILSDSLVYLASKAGFKNIKLYGNLEGGEFNKDNSYVLVLSAS